MKLWKKSTRERMSKGFFFDTYALIEIYKGSKSYEVYSRDVRMFLSKLNVLEFVHFLFREGRENEVKGTFEKLNGFCVDYDDEILLKAAKMKFEYKKERLS